MPDTLAQAALGFNVPFSAPGGREPLLFYGIFPPEPQAGLCLLSLKNIQKKIALPL
jgi:hypothetical protein